MSQLEANGITPTGILGGAALRAALRSQMVTVLQPFSEAPPSIYGVPIRYSANWDDTIGLALIGGFDAGVLVGIREDMTWTLSEEGVISDATGNVILNALQSDSSIMRCYWRLPLQAVQPLGPAGTPVKTLALACRPCSLRRSRPSSGHARTATGRLGCSPSRGRLRCGPRSHGPVGRPGCRSSARTTCATAGSPSFTSRGCPGRGSVSTLASAISRRPQTPTPTCSWTRPRSTTTSCWRPERAR
jgi:hypothetical protein